MLICRETENFIGARPQMGTIKYPQKLLLTLNMEEIKKQFNWKQTNKQTG